MHLPDGMHIAEDHFLVEIIDPETGNRKITGGRGGGDTTLTKALPVLRYRMKYFLINRVSAAAGTLSGMRRLPAGPMICSSSGGERLPSQIESVLVESEA